LISIINFQISICYPQVWFTDGI